MPKKVLDDEDKVALTRERIDTLYESYDYIFVAHSAGKDSTSAFNAVMDGWDRHPDFDEPIRIVHNCTEFKYPEERAYFDRIWRQYDEETYTYWAILPVLKSLLVNNKDVWRFPYDERDADRWVHNIPDFSDYANVELVTANHEMMDDFQIGWKHSDVGNEIVRQVMGDKEAVVVTGLRAQESMVRYGAILQHGGFLNERTTAPWDEAHPVYDWTARDIWAIHNQEDWDYNHAYDKMHRSGYPPTQARNGPMWGPFPIRAQDAYKIRHWYPELFSRAERRFEGSHLAFEFGNELFQPDKPDDESWEEFAKRLANSFDEEQQSEIQEIVERRCDRHWSHASVPFADDSPCDECGESWKSIALNLYDRLHEHHIEEH